MEKWGSYTKIEIAWQNTCVRAASHVEQPKHIGVGEHHVGVSAMTPSSAGSESCMSIYNAMSIRDHMSRSNLQRLAKC
jgi:hypothetical protein